jgi:response regulator RpfG family c-di-GMP phosphodiesterase
VRSGQQTRRPLRRRRERPDATQDTAAHIERQRLLVVEDDDGIAEPLVDGLSLEGFEIVRVRTGTEALTAGQVDLILLDLHLGHAYNPFDILNEKPPAFDVRQARP